MNPFVTFERICMGIVILIWFHSVWYVALAWTLVVVLFYLFVAFVHHTTHGGIFRWDFWTF